MDKAEEPARRRSERLAEKEKEVRNFLVFQIFQSENQTLSVCRTVRITETGVTF